MAGGHFKREISPCLLSSAIYLLDSSNNPAVHFPRKSFTEMSSMTGHIRASGAKQHLLATEKSLLLVILSHLEITIILD